MKPLRDIPIKRKVTLVILFICSVVVLLACAALGTYQIFQYRLALVRDTRCWRMSWPATFKRPWLFVTKATRRRRCARSEAEPYVDRRLPLLQRWTLFAQI